jgi:hypothetical protein
MFVGPGDCVKGSEGVLIWCDGWKDGCKGIANQVPVCNVARVKALQGGLPADAILIRGPMAHTDSVGAAALDVGKPKLVNDLNVSHAQGFGGTDARVLNFVYGDADHRAKGSGGVLLEVEPPTTGLPDAKLL